MSVKDTMQSKIKERNICYPDTALLKEDVIVVYLRGV